MHLAILFNAPSLPDDHPDRASEAGVLESVRAFEAALQGAGHEVRLVAAGASVSGLIAELSGTRRPDAVVNLCESFAGSAAAEPHVAALLELLGLPYTGSPPECLSLTRDKPRTKCLLRGRGLPTPEFLVLPPGTPLDQGRCRAWLESGPLIVKPAAEDASLGIDQGSVVVDVPALESRVRGIWGRYGPALVEEYIDGREFNVSIAVLPEPEALPLAEIEFRGAGSWKLVTYDAKWAEASDDYGGTPVRCPAELEPEQAAEIERIALAAFDAALCRDYGRIDLRLDAHGRPFVLEVNANPDLSPGAGFARAWKAAGRSYAELAARLVDVALARGTPSRRMEAAAAPRAAALARSRPPLEIRGFSPADIERLVGILAATGYFRPEEIAVGREVLEDAARQGPDGHYRVLVAEAGGQPIAWAAYGRAPLTDAAYDLYWIAVHPERQGTGVGAALLEDVERRVRDAGGRWLIAETSGSPLYAATCAFYRSTGFDRLGEIADFYRPKDSRLTFGKRLNGPRA